MSTVLDTGAICSMRTSTSWIGALSPTIPVRSCSRRRSMSRRATATTSSGRAGFFITPVTPSCAALSASSRVGGLEQRQRRHLLIVRIRHQLPRRRLVHGAGEDDEAGCSRRTADRASSSAETTWWKSRLASKAALRGTAISRSSSVMRILSAISDRLRFP